MNRKAKLWMSVGLAAAVATAAGTAMAATSQDTTQSQTQGSSQSAHSAKGHFAGKHGVAFGKLSVVTDLLKIDEATLKKELASGKSLADIAAEKGVQKQQLIDALVQAQSTQIDQAVKNGKMQQAKADQIKSKLAEQVAKLVDHKGGFAVRKGFEHKSGGNRLQAVASLLHMTKEDLIAQLKAGKSISDIAKEKGISEQQVIDTLLQKEKDAITKFVQKKGLKFEHKGKDDKAENSGAPAANQQ